MDFYDIEVKDTKEKSVKIVRPYFINKPNKDIMTKSGKFYAIWDKENNIWSTSIYDVVRIVDEGTTELIKELREKDPTKVYKQEFMEKNSSKILDEFNKWCNLQDDNFKPLNCIVKFNNEKVKRNEYCSFKLPYDICEGPMDAYEELVSTLYEPEEKDKIEWAIGAVITGESIFLEKAIALFGGPRTGKSTIIKIISKLFSMDKMHNYIGSISTNNLVKSNDRFSKSPIKDYKLILFDNDANLKRVDDNSVLNKIISHEPIAVDTKYGRDEVVKDPISFLFLATNNPIGMTDAKSGLKRRFLVVKPSNQLVEKSRYDKLMKQINNELGAIAYHCKNKYLDMGMTAYDNYESTEMYEYSNPLFSWISDSMNYDLKDKFDDGIGLSDAWEYFKLYCTESGYSYGLKGDFKNDMQEYFSVDKDVYINGKKHRYFYYDLKRDKFVTNNKPKESKKVESWLTLKEQPSLLDEIYRDEPAQYEVEYEPNKKQPAKAWSKVDTVLADIDTTKVHYVKPRDTHHIFIDFDMKDDNGNKQLSLSLDEAKSWPETYAETSKSGNGLHLHYIYDGDVSVLSAIFDEHIEIKKCDGGSAFRRKLIKCNNSPITHLKVGDLPLKEKKQVYNAESIKNEAHIRNLITACLRKEHHGATKPEVDFIKNILDKAYESGIKYDVSDMKSSVVQFAANSTNQAEACLKLVTQMNFKSSDDLDETDFSVPNSKDYDKRPIVIYDVEVFPNLFLICWKYLGADQKVHHMINPSMAEVRRFYENNRLIGFNNRRYDNHILYGAATGLTNAGIYDLSKKIITNGPIDSGYISAWNISYTEIYDYLPAGKKKGLKKWEIALGIHHEELGYDWNEPVDESLWSQVIKYCEYDVLATEAVWNETQGDFLARQILAELTGLTVNTATNKLTQKLIFGDDKNPLDEFRYRDLSQPVYELDDDMLDFLKEQFPEMMKEPFGEKKSLLPYFEGYKFEYVDVVDKDGKVKKKVPRSSYRDVEDVGEGGNVWAKPGCYGYTKVFDVTSQHPHSAMAEYLFGRHTRAFRDLVYARVYIKHGELDKVRKLFDGKLNVFLDDPDKVAALPDAFKTAINAVYGQTKARFECIFKDPRNVDNIVAKRGALFMIDLRNAVQAMGAEVIHVKTDSIKIVDPSPEVEKFIFEFGKRYGYSFEVEHEFEKICLVNDAVYIGKVTKNDESWKKANKKAKEKGLPTPTRWTATGKQFQVPYVFKTLFSHEAIVFNDLCETKSTDKGAIYLDFDEGLEDVSYYETLKEVRAKNDRGTKLLKKEERLLDEESAVDADTLEDLISKGHDRKFVGSIGLFCPVVDNTGGAKMVKPNNVGKYVSVEGTKDYRWKESETIVNAGLEDTIDESYYIKLVDEASTDIKKFCDECHKDYNWFVA